MQCLKTRKMLSCIKSCQSYRQYQTCYTDTLKTEFKESGMAFLRAIVKRLNKHSKLAAFAYQTGGMATSGDCTCYIMFHDAHGVYISFNADNIGGDGLLYRTITKLHDSHGGVNRYIKWNELDTDKFVKDIISIGAMK